MGSPAIKSKGASLSIGAAILGTLDMEVPGADVETFDANYLEAGVGVPYEPTGNVEGGSLSGNAWFGATSYAALLTLCKADPFVKQTCTITLSNSKTITFTAAGIKVSGAIALKDGVKCKFEAKLDGLPTYA